MIRPRITKLSDGRPRPWRVSYGKDGKRTTSHFETKIEAEEFSASLGVDIAVPELAMSTADRMHFSRLKTAAANAGKPIEEVIDEAVARLRETGLRTVTLGDLREAFLEDCRARNVRKKSLDNHTRILAEFVRGREDLPARAMSPQEARSWILGRYADPSSRASLRTSIRAMFRFAAGEERQWVGQEWFLPMKLPKSLGDKKPVSILTPDQADKLLHAALPSIRAGLAVQVFAAVRPEEVSNDRRDPVLEWEDIDFKHGRIEIRPEVDKIREGRTLHGLPACLWEWLKLTPPAKRKGPVIAIFHRNFRRARRLAADAAGIPDPWPQDVLRHTAASHGYHRDEGCKQRGLEWVIELLGHKDAGGMLLSRYKRAIPPALAPKLYEVLPDPSRLRQPTPGKRNDLSS